MALTEKQLQEVTAAGEAFLKKRRPPVEIRSQLDLAYRTQGQSVLVYELRSVWNNPAEIKEEPVAKTTFVQTQNHWKVYWMRADLKWHSFSPTPTVKTIHAFFIMVEDEA